jgi:hypothetical protein
MPSLFFESAAEEFIAWRCIFARKEWGSGQEVRNSMQASHKGGRVLKNGQCYPLLDQYYLVERGPP